MTGYLFFISTNWHHKMPKGNKVNRSGGKSKLINPNSRKASQLMKANNKFNKDSSNAQSAVTKVDLLHRKLLWFQDNVDSDLTCYTDDLMRELTKCYMARLDEELEEIEYVQNIGKRNCTQHSSRERMIVHTKEHEDMLFKSSGLEVPDLKSPTAYKNFLVWDGDAKYLPKIKMTKIRQTK